MLAKCAKCQKVFSTDHYGPNTCPACGAQLMLAAPPGAEAAPQPPPSADEGGAPQSPGGDASGFGQSPSGIPPAGEPGPAFGQLPPPGSSGFAAAEEDQPTPWEERGRLGFFPALFETIKQSFVDPVSFFARMRTDDVVQPLFYYWIVAGFGALVGNLWQAMMAAFRSATTPEMNLPADNPLTPFLQSMMEMQNSPATAMWTAIGGVVLAPVWLFVYAGILHLFAMLFRCANRGFSATLRSVAYASGPIVLAIVPFCGSFIGGLWSTVLMVIGLWKTQRGSLGGAIGAVVTPLVIFACCLCLGSIMLGVAGFAALAAAGAGN